MEQTTIDRFRIPLEDGEIEADGEYLKMTAQMKYDYLAAIHSMEQLLNVIEAMNKQTAKRANLREKISNSCKMSLKKLIETPELITIKQIDATIQGLQDCRNELLKLETADKETSRLHELVKDGVSAGR